MVQEVIINIEKTITEIEKDISTFLTSYGIISNQGRHIIKR